MMKDHPRAGDFDRATYLDDLELGPYELQDATITLGTIALATGEVPEIQIIADGRQQRLKMGQSLPVNGKRVYIRNPYSQMIRVQVGYGWPVNLNTNADHADLQFAEKLRSRVAIYEDGGQGVGVKRGALFMSKKSTFNFSANIANDHNALIIPKAKLSYIDTMPATIDQTGAAYYRSGAPVDDLVCHYGTYTDADMAAWIAAANWEAQLVPSTQQGGQAEALITPDTALIIHGLENDKLKVNADITELGNFDHEAR
jgi:hypothetical protein